MWFFSDEHRMLQETVRQFARTELEPRAAQLDEDEGFHHEPFKKMGELGLLGITVSEKDGGAGLDAVAATIAMEEIAAVDASTALSYLAHSILCVNQIGCNGSTEQKKHFLPKLISGEWLGGMGMSEPGAGSDALGMTTKANKSGSDYVLNGTKTWITNGPVGHAFYVYAKTGTGRKDVSTFLVERGMKGFSTGKKFQKMGMRGSPTGELIFEDCKVPEKNRVGTENNSIKMMMRNLDLERITISGISLGIARSAIAVSQLYAQERKQFGKPIGSFQMIQERLAEASSQYEACRALVFQTAKMWDLGTISAKDGSTEAAKAKLITAQVATRIAMDAIQILGGYGYTREFPVERYLRDAKLMEIGAGTNEILRIVIAKSMLGEVAKT
ncbi:acyl-CoA dehydrogenase family protein [bacterium]|jgi:isovaleryl-CoA dehydrogenase|nr:acyl-CoA dehydrogenase family protein [bacterium]